MSWIENPDADIFNGLNLTELQIDEAYLRLNNTGQESWIYSLSSQCHNCPYTKFGHIKSSGETIKISTVYNELWRIFTKDLGYSVGQEIKSNVLCDIEPDVGEFGVYNLKIENTTCSLLEEKQPVNIYLPLAILFFIIFGLIVIWRTMLLAKEKIFKRTSETDSTKNQAIKKRVKSLDTFRGLSIVVMIFVNAGAGRYWWLEHATWNGLTVGDLVFPFFLWIMGVCIPISVRSIVNKGLPKSKALVDIFRRSATLFLLGFCLGTAFGPPFERMRVFGVLQRFGVCYWVVGSIAVIFGKKLKQEPMGKWAKMFIDITELGFQWLIMLLLVLIHLLVVFLAPVPGCPTGYIGAGGKQDNWANKDCIGGVTKYIDVQVLGENHIYQNPTAKVIYESSAFDPESIFGCLLSIVHVFFGLQAGNTLLHFKKWKPLIIRWILWATVTALLGALLCNFSREDGVIPVNKNLWSLSFVLLTSSFAFIMLSFFYIIVDVLEVWDGAPLIQPGMNSITMYVGHSICSQMFPFYWYLPDARTHFVYLMQAFSGTFFWTLIAIQMARKKVFISV